MSTALLLRSVVLLGLAFAAAGLRAQPETRALSPDRVTFYTEPNFKGDSLVVEAGAGVENLDRMQRPSEKPWTFAISSVRIEGAAKATVYTAAGFRGEGLEITRSIPDLYAERRSGQAVGATWDRSIVSINVTGPSRVVVAPPAEPPATVVVVPPPAAPPPAIVEVRPRLSVREADAIIQRAYREVLDRPADPLGLRTYRDRLMREGWTERQVVQALQRSAEARAINPDEAIARMYREVLSREPDPAGLAHYRAKWRDGWTQGAIRDDLRRSQEGRGNHIRTAITRAYRDLLGREPDPSGYATYERLMRDKGYTERDVRTSIMASEEYRQRHGRR